ncbi:MAG: FlgD immunoglobulin-like domain containing protein [bacterium]|jgi:hypothetical protein
MRKFTTVLTLSAALILMAAASSLAIPPTMWEKEYGGPEYEGVEWIENTPDGGFIMVGSCMLPGASDEDIYIVKINAHGDTVWVRHYGGPEEQEGECVVPAPGGGYTIVGTLSSETVAESDILVLHVNEDGDSVWARTHSYGDTDRGSGIANAYGGGYVIAGWADIYGMGDVDVYAMKLDADGYFVSGIVAGGPEVDWAQRVHQTLDGGYIVVGGTRSYGSGSEDVYLLKFDSSLNCEWQKAYGGTGWDSGYDVCDAPDSGFVVAGRTPEGPGSNCAFLVRTDADGDSVWTRTYGGSGYDIAISITEVFDGSYVFSGMTDSWGAGSYDIWVQKVGPTGNPIDMETYGGANSERGNCIQATPDDGLIIAGRTYTNLSSEQAVAIRTLGYSPRFWAVSDIPGDQGGQLRLCWFRAAFDRFESPITITEYTVYRRDDPLPLSSGAAGRSGAAAAADGVPAGATGEPVVLQGTDFPPGDWDYITTVPALGENEYCCVVPTLCDWSVANGWCWSVFCVVAETAGFTFFASPVDSGCSFDNLEPSPPGGLYMPTATELAWDGAPEDDFDHFSVYGSASGDFGEAEFIMDVYVPEAEVSAFLYEYYHVTTLDHAGNESGDASTRNTFAGVPGEGLPVAFALRQNTPNPFSAGTAIGYDMPGQARVEIDVIDIEGRVVRTLVDEVAPAGRHSAAWDGRDGYGARVGPGIYFVRMRAGDFSATCKMMVLR